MPGYCEGEVCGRDGCDGVIASHEADEGCTCFINPPCHSCTEDRSYCPVCDWSIEDEPPEPIDHFVWRTPYVPPAPRLLNPLKVDYHSTSTGYHCMVLKGVYPPGMTSTELVKQLEGPFGGQLVKFGFGAFEYRLYTD